MKRVSASLFQSPTERFTHFHMLPWVLSDRSCRVSISYGEVHSFPHELSPVFRDCFQVSISYGEVHSFPLVVSLSLSNCQLGGLFARIASTEPSRLGSYGCTLVPFSLKFLAFL